MLELIDVHTYYGESHILHGGTLEVADGSAVGLLGRNGMGKTTTINSIIGLAPPKQGEIRFMHNIITGQPPHSIAKMGIGLVPQGRRIFPSLTVKENLMIGARNAKGSQDWNLERIYENFPILKERAHHRGNNLSGGEQQILAIGRALMSNPSVLLMDEPSEGLAPLLVENIGRIIKELKQTGISILLVEQNLTFALDLVQHVYIMSKGIIVYKSTPQELKNNTEVKAQYLGV